MKIEINVTEEQLNRVLSILALCDESSELDINSYKEHKDDTVDITDIIGKSTELRFSLISLALAKIEVENK